MSDGRTDRLHGHHHLLYGRQMGHNNVEILLIIGCQILKKDQERNKIFLVEKKQTHKMQKLIQQRQNNLKSYAPVCQEP